MSLLPAHPAYPLHAGEAALGLATAATPSLPPGPADRIYLLDGQLVVAVPLARYEALVGGQHSHSNHFPLPSHDTHIPAFESSAVPTRSTYGSPATTEVPYANTASISVAAESSGNSRLDNPSPRARTRVPVACVNCHELRKSCDAARPCQRCMRRGLVTSCVDHTRAARRSSASQSPSDSSPAMTLPPVIGGNVPFVGSEGHGGSSGQIAPLFPPQYPNFLLEDTPSVAATNNVNINTIWASY